MHKNHQSICRNCESTRQNKRTNFQLESRHRPSQQNQSEENAMRRLAALKSTYFKRNVAIRSSWTASEDRTESQRWYLVQMSNAGGLAARLIGSPAVSFQRFYGEVQEASAEAPLPR